jgi:citrate synthase
VHAEHGGGNNSTFVTHVVTSSGTDTYSAMSAALASLKGPRHGGANIKVVRMFEDLKQRVDDWTDDRLIEEYLLKLLRKEAFDRSGLIYGIGHAVYSISDPRAELLKKQVERLAREKGLEEEYQLYAKVAELAPEVIAHERKMYKGVSANVDFYSGFLYRLLEIPPQLFTPLFAMARIAGWSAHRIEEIASGGKIIRPAYKSVSDERDYVPMARRG